MFPFKSIPNSVADGDVCSALLFFVFFLSPVLIGMMFRSKWFFVWWYGCVEHVWHGSKKIIDTRLDT